jgi:hypothetical protein
VCSLFLFAAAMFSVCGATQYYKENKIVFSKKKKASRNVLLTHKFAYLARAHTHTHCRWDRALELAVSNKTHVDTVLVIPSSPLLTFLFLLPVLF